MKRGRSLKFTPEQLITLFDRYFANTDINEWTVTGLALASTSSKQLMNDYEKRQGYSGIVKTAKLKIENSYELALRKSGGANNIFALKNFGWTDKSEVKVEGNVTLKTITGVKIVSDDNGTETEITTKTT